MASSVDIANLTLSHLGESPLITALSPVPSGGAWSKTMAVFYPIARDALLEMHDWRFAVRRQALSELDLGTDQPDTWDYAYALPSDCLKPRRVLVPGADDDSVGEDFKTEIKSDGTQLIYTNAAEAILVYTKLITDTTKFTPLFTLALSRLLASMAAGSIIKGEAGMRVAAAQMQIFLQVEGSRAMASDANSRQAEPYKDRKPDAIAARA